MKLVIQIPCHNEEHTLALVFEKMPRSIEGIQEIEYQIINDGSTDRTEEVARELGVHHIIRVPGKNRRWLGRAFRMGIDSALLRGADIIVNTDGDNQYPSDRITDLVRPIVEGRADIVIGDRDPSRIKEFSLLKRFFQKLGNMVVSYVTGEEVRDAVSGFRAYSRRSALSIHILTNFTYTVDSLIQAYKKGLDIEWVPIEVNAKTRESRLFSGILSKVRKSGGTILRISTVYEPFRIFLLASLLLFIPGIFAIVRFLYFYFLVEGEGRGHVQSVILGGVLILSSIQMFVLGVISDLLSANRQLLEETLTRVKTLEISAENNE